MYIAKTKLNITKIVKNNKVCYLLLKNKMWKLNKLWIMYYYVV